MGALPPCERPPLAHEFGLQLAARPRAEVRGRSGTARRWRPARRRGGGRRRRPDRGDLCIGEAPPSAEEGVDAACAQLLARLLQQHRCHVHEGIASRERRERAIIGLPRRLPLHLGVLLEGVDLRVDVLLHLTEAVHSLNELGKRCLRAGSRRGCRRWRRRRRGRHSPQDGGARHGAQPGLYALHPGVELLLHVADVGLDEDGVDALLGPAQSYASMVEFLEARVPVVVHVHDGVQRLRRDVEVDAEGAHDLVRPRIVEQLPDLLPADGARCVEVGGVEERLKGVPELLGFGDKGGELILLLHGGMDNPLDDHTDHQVH
mmetsp:Transcript_18985/g.55042  ORF Transcript_18985/g.55042 Transcript_18985/m.55042 type:complete len:319 (-) Transcript_18985:1127-2083(-)